VTFRLSGSSRIQGLNSVATQRPQQHQRWPASRTGGCAQAGSRKRDRGQGGASVAAPPQRQAMHDHRLRARASADAAPEPRRAARARAGRTAPPAARASPAARAGRKASWPSRRPMMRGKCASATSTWCNVATSVTPRSRAPATSAPMAWRDRVGSSADSGSSTSHSSPRPPYQQGARQADALALATREAVHPLKQLVGQIKAVQRLVGGGDVVRIEQRAHAGQQPHGRQAAGQHRRDHTLARRQRRHLRAPGTSGRAAAAAAHAAAATAVARPHAACRPTAATRRPAPAAGWSCRRPTGR
jgi:hypothetical protein